MTTKEVAALLRIKERKVYDLAGAGDIPLLDDRLKLYRTFQELTSFVSGKETGIRSDD